MNLNNKHILLTTPIFYPSGSPHIGTITTAILVDFLNRSFKLFNYKTRFVTGMDEHGQKVATKAQLMNMDTQTYVDQVASDFQKMFQKLNIDYDVFYRTTNTTHKQQVQYIWQLLYDKNLIYKSKYVGLYSPSQEAFVDKRDGFCDAIEITEEVYFFRMSLFEERLRSIFEKENFVVPAKRVNELIGFISNGLKDLCISRERLKWGIKVPNDNKGVIYVWLDALTNYINSCNFPNTDEYWSRVIHVIGKDISIFHGIYWICLLLALDNYPKQLQLLIHNWWMLQGKKSSKSSGNTIDPQLLLSQYPVSAIRFYFIHNNLLSQDNSFQSQDIPELYNTFLVNKLSNLIYRITSLMAKHNIPLQHTNSLIFNDFIKQLQPNLEKLDITSYLNCLFAKADELNSYVEKHCLWQKPHLIVNIIHDVYNLYNLIKPIYPNIPPIDNMIFKKLNQ